MVFFFLMILRPTRSTLTDTLFPYTTLFRSFDFERLRRVAPVKLLVSATRVRDGGARIFRNDDISLDAVMASTSLPSLHHAVSIDDDWRSEERRVGKECVSTCRSRWSPYH